MHRYQRDWTIVTTVAMLWPNLRLINDGRVSAHTYESGMVGTLFTKPTSNAPAAQVSAVHLSNKGPDISLTTEVEFDATNIGLDTGVQKLAPFIVSGHDSGKYRVTSLRGGKQLFLRMSAESKTFIKQWANSESVVSMKIIGQADGLTSHQAYYRGDLGQIDSLRYYKLNDTTAYYQSFIPHVTRLKNLLYGVLRAFDAATELQKDLNDSRIGYQLYANEVPESGGAHRKVVVVLSITNGLKKDYDSYNPIQKLLFRLCI